MLYVYYGSHTSASVHKAHTLINSLRAKRPDATFVHVEAGAWSPAIVDEHSGGQGLFSNKYIIFFDRVLENADARDSFLKSIPVLHESTNIFIVLEGKLNAEYTKAFQTHADKSVVTDEPAKDAVSRTRTEFNIFSLADAVGARDPFMAWNIYRQAIDAGLEVESIVGTLFWQVKSMILAMSATSASSAGLSPFVYTKAKKASALYSREELGVMLEELIMIYHDSHRGLVDGEYAVERYCLRIRSGVRGSL